MSKIKTAALDDEPLILEMMKELLEEEAEIEVVATAEDQKSFLAIDVPFDVAIIDISVGGKEGGLDVLANLTGRPNPPACIILSAHDEVDYAPRCLKLGAKGYVNKSRIITEMAQAISAVKAGELYVSGPNRNYILNQFSKS